EPAERKRKRNCDGPSARRRPGRTRASLPAEDRASHRHDQRRRGARAVERRQARCHRAGDLRPDRRTGRDHRRADRMGVPHGPAPVAGVAGPGDHAQHSGQHLGAFPPGCGVSRLPPAPLPDRGRALRSAYGRADRGGDAACRSPARHSDPLPHQGNERFDRRFRNRLFLAAPASPAAFYRAQDRPIFRARCRHVRGLAPDRQVGDRPCPRTRHERGGGRGGGPADAGSAFRAGLRPCPRLPDRPPNEGRGARAVDAELLLQMAGTLLPARRGGRSL
ncbi:MAG: diguanylate cyclase/phosphodiesterase (GGDEF & EAL domains) with PAS/PAC sensor(s), partial [uncultured Sphingomonadaceae bacterium]